MIMSISCKREIERQLNILEECINDAQKLQEKMNEISEELGESLNDVIEDMQDDVRRINYMLNNKERGEE